MKVELNVLQYTSALYWPRNVQITTEERVKGDLFSFSFVILAVF